MKAVLFSEYFYPHWTGIAQACATLAQQLAAKGHQVTVVTTQYDKSLKRQETHGAVLIIRTDVLLKFSRTYLSPQTLIEAILRLGSCDVVVINSPHSLILPLSILARMMGKKLYIFHQGDLTLPRQTGNWLLNRVVETVFDVCTIPACALANHISTYTRDYAQHSRVMRYFMHKFFPYIPAPTLIKKPPSKKFKQVMSSLKAHHVLIGFAGRFVEEKGFDLLFMAMPEVLQSLPDAHFVFAGQTKMEYEPFFEKHASLIHENKDRVTFLGLLDQRDLAYFYKNLDLFVVSSRSDCFPLTQMEAALSGVPIVVTNIPGARQLVKETGQGRIAKSESPHNLAQAIVDLLSRPIPAKNVHNTIVHYFKKYEAFKLD